MRTLLSVLLIATVSFTLNAQKVDKKTFDYGIVEQWDNTPAEFVVTNNTKQQMVFLPTMPNKDVLVEITPKKVEAGGKAVVLIYYYTDSKGLFSNTTTLYTGNSPDPIKLTVKGDIRSFAYGAVTACPTLAPKTDEDKEFDQEIMVIDKETKQPILEANVQLELNGKKQYKGVTNSEGLVQTRTMLGRFDIIADHTGYYPNKINTYLAMYRGRVIIELEPMEIPDVAYAEPIPEPEPEKEPVKEVAQAPTIGNTGGPPPPAPIPVEEEVIEEEEDDEPWVMEIEELDEASEEPPVIVEETPAPTVVDDALTAEEPIVIPTTKELSVDAYQPNNVLFLIDISRSMNGEELPKMKESMKELVSVLRPIDKITVMTFNMEPTIVMPTTSADNKEAIYNIIDSLSGFGFTHGVKGLETAYDIIKQEYIKDGNNQIIISTDGVFNGPKFDEQGLYKIVRDQEREGIVLSVVGFGDDPSGRRLMRRMANYGNGSFIPFERGSSTTEALTEEIRSRSLIKDE